MDETPPIERPAWRLWIVSPLLRDTESFLHLRNEIAAACPAAGIAAPIHHIVVDDSAGIDTEVRQLDELDNVSVLTPPFNLGHQRALVYGLRTLATTVDVADIVVTMDSDGEDKGVDVPRLVKAVSWPISPLAIARRTERTESLVFRLMYPCFRLLFRLFTGLTVRSGNFAAQYGASLTATINHPSFDLCYSSTLIALPRPTAFVPCARGRRFAGQSRMNGHSLIAHGIRMMLPFSERIAVRMLVLSTLSFGALGASLILVWLRLLDGVPVTTIVGALVALLAVAMGSFTAFMVLFSGFSVAPIAPSDERPWISEASAQASSTTGQHVAT